MLSHVQPKWWTLTSEDIGYNTTKMVIKEKMIHVWHQNVIPTTTMSGWWFIVSNQLTNIVVIFLFESKKVKKKIGTCLQKGKHRQLLCFNKKARNKTGAPRNARWAAAPLPQEMRRLQQSQSIVVHSWLTIPKLFVGNVFFVRDTPHVLLGYLWSCLGCSPVIWEVIQYGSWCYAK